MPGKDFVRDLKSDYVTKRPFIVKRLAEFRSAGTQGNRKIFEELCYCILTAGSSAKMGMRTIAVLKDIIHSAGEQELQQRARAHHVRFWRLRPSYIVQTREYLRDACGMKLQTLLESFESPVARRDFFAQNKSIKGLGYKEASHFLRNVGYSGYAILDKHILNSLREMGVINPRMRPSGREGYLAIEKKLRQFADEIGIDMDHLDLLLWSRKTGEILK
jgi:N-glycosylase/DNA lyase